MKRAGSPPGRRPHTWTTGLDPVRHDQYGAFLQCRAQANYRGEEWGMTFEEYEQLWQGQWHLRGRDADSLSMSRRDRDQPWTLENTYLDTRRNLNRRQGLIRAQRNRERTP